MDGKKFKERLKLQLQAHHHLKNIKFLDYLLNYVTKGKFFFTQQDLAETIQLIERIRISHLSSEKKEIYSPKLSSQDFITSDYIADKILPLIEDIRIKIFNSSAPPFSTIEEAVYWIEKMAAIKSEEEKKKRKEAWKGIKRLRIQTGQDLKIEDRCLLYLSKDNSVKTVPFDKNSPLAILEYESRKIENMSGFPQLMSVNYILTGIAPFIPRTSISIHEKISNLPKGESLSLKEVTIKIKSPDFALQELINIYKTLRKELNLVKKKSLNEKDWRIYRLIKKLKIPLDSKKKKYWIFAMENWNIDYPKERYNSWQGLQKRFQRTKDKLEFH